MFLYFHVDFGFRVERNKIRMSRGMRELRDSRWLVKFHLISTAVTFSKAFFHFTCFSGREGNKVSENIIKFIYHENRFASLKADLSEGKNLL